MSALAVVAIPELCEREMFFAVSILALLGVFGDLHPAYAELLPRERRNVTRRVVRGEPRPEGYATVELPARWPSTDYLAELVHEWGYCPSAAWSVPHHEMPTSIDRRQARCFSSLDEIEAMSEKRLAKECKETKYANFAKTPDPLHPYIPASPMRRTMTSIAKRRSKKFLEENDILKTIRDVHMQLAVGKCITTGKSSRAVALEEGLSFVALHRALARANERIRDLDKENDEQASEVLKEE